MGAPLIDALKVVASSGDAGQRSLALMKLQPLDDDVIAEVLSAILISPREPVPTNREPITRWLDHQDSRIRLASIRLAGRWKIADVFPMLTDRASRIRTDAEERLAACVALIEIDPIGATAKLEQFADRKPKSVRTSAIAALARVSPKSAAERAVRLLADLSKADQIGTVIRSFVEQQDGADALKQALTNAELPESVVQQSIAPRSERPASNRLD